MMSTGRIILILLIIGDFSVFVTDCLDEIIIPDADNELLEYMQRASFDMNYGQENFIRRAINSSDILHNFKHGTFNDILIEYEGSQIALAKLQVSGEPNPRLSKSVPNMMYGYLDTALEWNTVIVDGKYEIYDKPGVYDSNWYKGELRLIWINLKAEGRIAFHPLEVEDGFISTNYDLEFTGETFQIITVNSETSRRASEILQKTSKRIKSRLQNDIQWKLQYNLRENVDRILKNRSMKQIFGNNEEIVKKYRAFIQENELTTNKFVDNLLGILRLELDQTGFWEFDLPNFTRNFTKNLGDITVAGSLELNDGKAKTLSAVRRKSSFSLVRKDSIEFIGFLEFTNLSAHLKQFIAKVWHIENSGEVVSTVVDSSMFIKFIVIEDDKSATKYKLAGYELAVFVHDVRVEVLGLSFLVGWLHPLIETSACNHLKVNIPSNIEENMKQVLDSTIQTLSG